MSSNDQVQLIIKKKKGGGGEGHHGGAWKVAYADFVTAMMAFFMLMWLLNATTEEQRKGIADYFNPKVPISETSSGGASLFGGDTIFVTEQLISHGRGGAQDVNDDSENEEEVVDPAQAETPPPVGVVEKTPPEVEPEQSEISEEDQAALMETDPSELTDEQLEAAEAEKRDREMRRVERAFAELEAAEEGNELLKHLSMRMTPDGLMIEITETAGDPLFSTGSAEPSEMMRSLISVVAPIVSSLENRIAIVGHTDGRRYSAGSRYTNWDLSADRANAARRLLVEFGLASERLARITGAADREPLSEDVLAPENRRIGITLLREPPKRPRQTED